MRNESGESKQSGPPVALEGVRKRLCPLRAGRGGGGETEPCLVLALLKAPQDRTDPAPGVGRREESAVNLRYPPGTVRWWWWWWVGGWVGGLVGGVGEGCTLAAVLVSPVCVDTLCRRAE